MAFKSKQDWVSDGSLDRVTPSIDYLDRLHISVKVSDPTVAWVWDANSIRLGSPLAAGETVSIVRHTPIDNLMHLFSTKYAGGGRAAWTNIAVDENFLQIQYILQEVAEGTFEYGFDTGYSKAQVDAMIDSLSDRVTAVEGAVAIPHFPPPLAYNGGSAAGGMVQSADQVVRDLLWGGDADEVYANIPPVMAEVAFVFPTQLNNLNRHTTWPTRPGTGTGRYVPLAEITPVSGRGAPVLPPLFVPTKVSDSAILEFKYVGDRPLVTTIKGSLEMWVRVGNFTGTTSVPKFRNIFRLIKVDGLPAEDSGEGSQYILGVGSLSPDQIHSGLIDFSLQDADNGDPYVQLNSAVLAAVSGSLIAGGSSHGYTNHWIQGGETGLREPDSPGGPTDPVQRANLKTSEWIPYSVPENPNLRQRSIAFQFQKRTSSPILEFSTRLRVQAKLEDDSVVYVAGSTAPNDIVVQLPPNTKEFRFYFCGPTDIMLGLPSVYSCTEVPAAAFNRPGTPGTWYSKTYEVAEQVTFYPGTTYCFSTLTTAYTDDVAGTASGYRIVSGGLSILADYTRHLKRHYNLIKGA